MSAWSSFDRSKLPPHKLAEIKRKVSELRTMKNFQNFVLNGFLICFAMFDPFRKMKKERRKCTRNLLILSSGQPHPLKHSFVEKSSSKLPLVIYTQYILIFYHQNATMQGGKRKEKETSYYFFSFKYFLKLKNPFIFCKIFKIYFNVCFTSKFESMKNYERLYAFSFHRELF